MLRVCLELDLSLWDDPVHEKEPLLHLWLSQDCSRHLLVQPLSAATTHLSIDECFPVSSEHQLPLLERIQTANVNMDLWCHLRNKHGASCLNQIGSSRVPVYELLSTEGATVEQDISIPSWGDPSGTRPDNSVDNFKGHLKVRCTRMLLNGNRVPAPSARLIQMMGQVHRYKQQTYQHYIGSCVAMFRKFQSTWPVVRDINAYVYNARTELLPALGYLALGTGGTQVGYFLNAARLVLARDGLSLDSYDWINDSRGPALLARVLTISANFMTYVPDIVFLPSRVNRKRFLRKALESFDIARVRLGGDCEDLAREVLLVARELQELKGPLPDQVRQMQQLAQRFVFAMALGGVGSAEINGEWAMMIPRTLWEYWWARGNGPAAPAPPAGTVPLVLEPTGFLRPEAVSRSMQQEEQAQTLLEADGQLGGARKWFHYTYGQRSKFYQTGQILFTDEYISGSGISGVDNSMPDASSSSSGLFVCFALCRPSSTPGQDPTVGVEFDELVRGDLQQVLLWSEPAINQEELACIRDNLRDAHPMPPLVWPEETATTTPDALQQDLQRRLDELTRLTSEDSAADTVQVEFFIQAALLSPERVLGACRACGIVQQADVQLERLTPELRTYRLRLWCRTLPQQLWRQRLRTLRERRMDDPEEGEEF